MKAVAATALVKGVLDDDGEAFDFIVECYDGAMYVRIVHDGNPFSMDDDGWMTTHPSNGGPGYTMPGERLLDMEDEVLAMARSTPLVAMFGVEA